MILQAVLIAGLYIMTKTVYLIFFLCGILSFAQQKWDIRFYNEINGRDVEIFADNNEVMPMSAEFDFELQNMTSTLPDKEIVVVPPQTKKFPIAKLSLVRDNAGNGFSYTSTYNFGDALQNNHDAYYIYSLPFEKGKTQLIFQGYNGKFSHQNASALDFDLKTGDKVMAAREGTVVEVVSNNTRNCADLSCARFNNYILILHSDGTFADYSHLKLNGTVVNVGDRVEKGQLIGYSGSTGFSNGPHLHFSVFINRINGERTYIKTKFRTSEQEATFLEEKKSYTKNY